MARKTEEEMFDLIDQWEASKLTQSAFCESHELSMSTFTYWRGKYLDSKNDETSDFVKLEPEWSSSLEVVYPNGVKVRLPERTSLSEVRILIQLV